MRQKTKKQMQKHLAMLRQLHKKIELSGDSSERMSILQGCQEMAISVGECVERELPANPEIVSLFEQYCELVFQIAQSEKTEEVLLGKLDRKLIEAETLIMQQPCRYRVVFLPYKVEMWDAMESVWEACMADESCECAVVALPYFEADTEQKKWEYRYDGPRFEDKVKLVSYKDYDLSQMKPDIAYIHNPYDDTNLLTSVYPDYYSKALKEHVGKLVYIPYYVTPGWIAKDHLFFPVYRHMDYMIAQSDEVKSCFSGLPYEKKVIPLGSPKFDKIIHKCAVGGEMPKEWQYLLQDKKVILLNTSIGDVLTYGDRVLKKLRQLFTFVKSCDAVGLIWRPHPLLKKTVLSMRPELIKEYQHLVDEYIENKVGVFDTTTDVENSIALCDAYMDAGYSSVANLAGIAGKPIFLLNYLYCLEEEQKAGRLRVAGITRVGDVVWLLTELGAIASMNIYDRCLHLKRESDKEFFMEALTTQNAGLSDQIVRIIHHKDSIYYFPYEGNAIAEYCVQSDTWNYHDICLKALWSNKNKEVWMPMVFDADVCGEELWVTTGYTDRIMRFHTKDHSFELFEPEGTTLGYGAIAASADGLWITDSATGNILYWQPGTNRTIEYAVPREFHVYKPEHGGMTPYCRLFDMGRYVITLPAYSNGMVRLDKQTGDVRLLLREFWEEGQKVRNGFDPAFIPVSVDFDGRIDDEHLLVQRMADAKAVVLNIVDGTYEYVEILLSDKELKQYQADTGGFQRTSRKEGFYCKESDFFTVESFVQSLFEEKMDKIQKRQSEALADVANNLDGTCGQKVHAYMIEQLKGEERDAF